MMTFVMLFLATTCLGQPQPTQGVPPAIDFEQYDLTEQDRSSVVELLEDLPVWFLKGSSVYYPGSMEQPLPHVEAYLRPSVDKPRLRRGLIYICYRDPKTKPLTWKRSPPPPYSYAQVASPGLTLPVGQSAQQASEHLFSADTDIADADLVSISDTVRTPSRENDAILSHGASGCTSHGLQTDRVGQITRSKDTHSVNVYLASGCFLELARRNNRWSILSSGRYVS